MCLVYRNKIGTMDADTREKRMISAYSCVLRTGLNRALGVFAHRKPRLLVDVNLSSMSCRHLKGVTPRFSAAES